MSVSLYVDEHVPRAITDALRVREVDVITAQDDGSAGLPDDMLLQRATKLGRILVSHDKDFLRITTHISRQSQSFLGVIYAEQRSVEVGRMINDLELLAKATSIEEWSNRLQYLPLP